MKGLRVYEKTSEVQEKLAGQSIQIGKEFHVARSAVTASPNDTRLVNPTVSNLQQSSGLSIYILSQIRSELNFCVGEKCFSFSYVML